MSCKRCLIITCFVLMTMEMIESKRHHHNVQRSIRRGKPQLIRSHQLTEDEQNLVITVSNQIRKNVNPQPSRMLRLKYNPQLAEHSSKQANKCVYEHSQPEAWNGTPFTQPGENLYYITDLNLDIATSLTRAICKWASESDYYDYTTTTCDRGKECGHYTELVWADNNIVACAVSDCRNVMIGRSVKRSVRIVWCNYTPGGNYYGEKPYESGTASCSHCRQGEDCVCGDNDSKESEKLFCESGTVTTDTSATTTTAPRPTTQGKYVLSAHTSKGVTTRKGKTSLKPRINTTHVSNKDTASTSSKDTISTEVQASKPSKGATGNTTVAPIIDTSTTTIPPVHTTAGISQDPSKTGDRGTTLGKGIASTSSKNTTSTEVHASKPSKGTTGKKGKSTTVAPSIDTPTPTTAETSKYKRVLLRKDVIVPTKDASVSSVKLDHVTPIKNTTATPNTTITSNQDADKKREDKTVNSINNTSVSPNIINLQQSTLVYERRNNKTRVIVNSVTNRKAIFVVKSSNRRARKNCRFCSFGSLFTHRCYKKCHSKYPAFDHYKSAKLCFNIL